MNKNLYKLFIFAVGAVIGSAATWFYTKKYYEKIADEEIESVKEVFSQRKFEPEKISQNAFEPENRFEEPYTSANKPSLKDYVSMVDGLGYKDYAGNRTRTEEPEEVDDVERPYVITPEEFGCYEYQEVSLTHYSDGILTDEQDNPIEDVDGTVGADYASHFGEYEDDSVFVRNDRMKMDFEILADLRKYSDLPKNNPRPAEDE